MLERLAETGLDRAPGFRLGLVGGGPVSERALSVGGMLLLPTYGMTETASQVATADPADPRIDRLVVLQGAEISIGAENRIVVDGPMVSSGDLDAPDRTGPLLTGDVGRLHDGRLEVLGRADSIIVTGGENVMPERLERIIGGLPGAGDVAVVGVPDETWGSVVAVAFTGDADQEDLEKRVRQSVAGHEVPRRWIRAQTIPMLGIGKIDRRAVAKLFD
jgi:O-succinylbenzoic acid--CoA ligase